MAPPRVSSPEMAVIEIHPDRDVLEWFSIDKSDTDVAAANIEWTGILKEIRQQPGCTVAAHAFTTESPIQEWVIIGKLLRREMDTMSHFLDVTGKLTPS